MRAHKKRLCDECCTLDDFGYTSSDTWFVAVVFALILFFILIVAVASGHDSRCGCTLSSSNVYVCATT